MPNNELVDIQITKYIFNIKTPNGTGTAFYYPTEQCDFLISVKHLFKKKDQNEFHYQKVNGKFGKITGEIIYPKNNDIDIVAIKVIKSNIKFEKSYYISFNSSFTYVSQEAYFAGYPYGFISHGKESINQAMCLVKKTMISGIKEENGAEIGYYMDGHNNPGFSGGPCFCKGYDGKWKIFGIVNSILPQENPLYDEEKKLRMVLVENSGIFIVHKIDFIIDAINTSMGTTS